MIAVAPRGDSAASVPRYRVCIAAEDQTAFNLTCWARTIPALHEAGFEVVSISLFPEKLAKYRGLEIPFWYFKVMGLRTCLLLALYTMRVQLQRLAFGFTEAKIRSWGDLANRHGCDVRRFGSPNDADFIEHVKTMNVDVLFIMVGFVLKGPIIKAPRIGVINKHAALLPSCKGLLPFFWAQLKDLPTGVTFHEVTEGIDEGRILAQREIKTNGSTTVLAFYKTVFAQFPELAVEAARALCAGKFVPYQKTVESSYFSLPLREDYLSFARKGFRVVNWSDILC